jgi:hypothetical protein
MLVAIADRAGGDWGQRARVAAEALSTEDMTDSEAIAELLLSDLRDYFDQTGTDRAPSMHLTEHLRGLEGRPWAEYHRGGPITQNQLANLLRPFGISSQTIRVEVPPPIPPPYGTGAKGRQAHLHDHQGLHARGVRGVVETLFVSGSPLSSRHNVTSHGNRAFRGQAIRHKRICCDGSKSAESHGHGHL